GGTANDTGDAARAARGRGGGDALVVAAASRARNGIADAGATDAPLAGSAGVATGAAVRRVGVGLDLAAVIPLVAVAVGIAAVATAALARAGAAGRRDVVGGARHGAAAAVGDVIAGIHAGVAAECGGRGAAAVAVDAAQSRAARDVAHTAVEPVGDVGLAAIRLLVAVAVGPAEVARAIAEAAGARRVGDVVVGTE